LHELLYVSPSFLFVLKARFESLRNVFVSSDNELSYRPGLIKFIPCYLITPPNFEICCQRMY